jgi:4'-phosphopantetheinyl transferase
VNFHSLTQIMTKTSAPILYLADVRLLEPVDHHLAKLLSSDELRRAQSMRREQIRERYLQTRLCVRRFLGQQLGKPAEQLSFGRTEAGKPFLMNEHLHFNISHSHDFLALVCCNSAPAGVDMETISDQRQWSAIASRYFHSDEVTWLNSLPHPQGRDSFYRLWTLKEAFFKALGTGISAGLDKVRFQLTDRRITMRAEQLDQQPQHWQFFQWRWQAPEEGEAGYLALACHISAAHSIAQPGFYPADIQDLWQLQLIAQSSPADA